MKRTPEFGYLGTIQEQLLYMLIEEQRKTNELLEKLVPTPTVKTVKK